tara:strand:+ start:2836 stop:3273 length:438 start_codon:yes stop_codon:yes gene_type:complete
VKKKYFATSQDKRDWDQFIKKIANIQDKDADLDNENIRKSKIRKLDLHGFSLVEANKAVKKFIFESIRYGYKKILIVTGKGIRSKVYNDPYRSEKMNILKYSVPEYIKNDDDLFSEIRSISKAEIKDGGEGAFYVFLKEKKSSIK